ncbi:MAG: hypothetical protein JO351_12660 [Candidatus Eremiobacteraeota bacterium]|nr:hypothetical protein [Candidatus Eremiobacteraeota bacterium]
MSQTTLRRALLVGAALAFVSGCSGSGPNSTQNSSPVTPSSHAIPAGMRMLPGPVVSGPRIVPIVPLKPNAPLGWPPRHRHKEILFVADGSGGVLMYNPRVANSAPTGSITTGVNAPSQVAVDGAKALYVANSGNNTVTVYPKGATSPSLTITGGLNSPYGVTVDSKGNVFVSNLGSNTVTAYKAGQTSPYATINFSALGQPVGLGSDALDNIWVACDSTNKVFEIPAGSTTPKDAGLSGLNGPISVSFGKSDIMYVSNFAASNVNVYAYGTTTPSATITTGIEHFGPTLGGFTAKGAYFQSNQGDNVVGYKPGATSPFSTLTGATSPLGVASEPLVTK